eukprot:370260_1
MALIFDLYLFLIFVLTIVSFLIIVKCMKNLLCKTSIQIKDKKETVTVVSKSVKPKLKQQPLTISYKPFIRYATICSLISYFITHVSVCINLIIYTIIHQEAIEFGDNAFGVATLLSWLTARILMNSVFVSRLKSSFIDTIWMYNRYIFILLYALLLIMSIQTLLQIVLAFSVFIIGESMSSVRNAMESIMTASMAFLLLFNTIFQVLLMYLYQRRLFQLIRSYCHSFHAFKANQQTANLDVDEVQFSSVDTNTHTMVSLSPKTIDVEQSSIAVTKDVSFALNDNDRDRALELIESHGNQTDRYTEVFEFKKLELINTIAQYTILFGISVISLCVVLIFVSGSSWVPRVWQVFVFVLDAFIDSCCLYAHFSFGIKSYRFCCVRRFCLHTVCVSCFAKCVNKSIK